jgi:hypothetical protein
LGESVLRVFPVDAAWISTPGWRFQLFPGAVTAKLSGAPGIGPSTGVYPILSFNTPTQAVFYPSSLLGAASAGIDDKGKVVVNSFSDAKVSANRSGPGGSVPKGGAFVEGDEKTGNALDAFHSDNPKGKKHVDKMKSQIKSQLKNGGVRVEIETLGVPDLLPGRTAQIDGLGPRFDWNYGIHEVVHTLGTGGFSTQWVGYYNSSAIQKDVGKAFGLVLNPPAEEGSEGSSTEGGPG